MDEQKQKDTRSANRGMLAAVIGLVVVVLIVRTVWNQKNPAPDEAQKLIWVQVIHKDGSTRDFDLTTTQENLGPALVDGGVVENNQGSYGLYILTADGETADEDNQEWWCITQGGEQLNTGADQTPIADGDRFELTLTVGYDA